MRHFILAVMKRLVKINLFTATQKLSFININAIQEGAFPPREARKIRVEENDPLLNQLSIIPFFHFQF